jgi:hypothetical protein
LIDLDLRNAGGLFEDVLGLSDTPAAAKMDPGDFHLVGADRRLDKACGSNHREGREKSLAHGNSPGKRLFIAGVIHQYV